MIAYNRQIKIKDVEYIGGIIVEKFDFLNEITQNIDNYKIIAKIALFCNYLCFEQVPSCLYEGMAKILNIIKTYIKTDNLPAATELSTVIKNYDRTYEKFSTQITKEVRRDCYTIPYSLETLFEKHFNPSLIYCISQASYNHKNYNLIILYIDMLLNKKQYITSTKTLENFAAQDIDTLTQLDIDMILDYIKEEQEVDLTELSVHPRILAEFVRRQI